MELTKQLTENSQESKPFNPSDYRVLIIEDEDMVGDVTGRMLRAKGYDSKWVQNGREALETIPVYKPNVALVDNNMPEMNGEKFISALRTNSEYAKHSKLKLIATGQGFSKDILGMCNGTVTKPFELEEFYSILENVLSK